MEADDEDRRQLLSHSDSEESSIQGRATHFDNLTTVENGSPEHFDKLPAEDKVTVDEYLVTAGGFGAYQLRLLILTS